MFAEMGKKLLLERYAAGVTAGEEVEVSFTFATCSAKGTRRQISEMKNRAYRKAAVYPFDVEV